MQNLHIFIDKKVQNLHKFKKKDPAAITLLVAESDPKEKDVMIQIIMNFLNWEAGP